ncbi:hypothetical protein [Pseudarthrobacter cellobiosi]|uniref:hypothetical protein n=1 Tax=Pseudarthrobacter cellobiosi TaxID=2953654 RepID=UPI00208DEE80|nr:hypothetical protein [Pseudarthrobacter sp. HLT1-5]MCO4256476.1 hypothetical protein [Pseudarthrobacter sp. HLT1-5]
MAGERALIPASRNYSVMSANSYFAPANAEEKLSWHVEVVEPREAIYVILGNLAATGDGVHCSVVAMSILDNDSVSAEGDAPTYEEISRALPDSYLMHGLYDTAAAAARSSASILGRGPLVPSITPEAKITKHKTVGAS